MARAGIGTELEGIHAVEAALEAGRVRKLLVERRRADRPEVATLVDRARSAGITVELVDDVRPYARTGAPQGVVALARPLPTVDIADLAMAPVAAVLVLDRVQDQHNVGAVARSALAAGMTGLVIAERRAAPLGPAAFKAASGALEHLPVAVVSSVADAVERLRRGGLWVVSLDAGSETLLFGLELLADPVAVVVGAEGAGVSRLVRERSDVVASIPLRGPVESLNASVAGALAAFEVLRVREGL